ncbi:hypothetical protein JTE90_014298 [Oedothorax gibbosus]|uniref:Acetoacetyl-CoA synthetase n=1 Tax=Oedothorax gibbosus TaxID=931172 RepID=A0AAV6UJI7_9ARAC|nr:hypothetical protein JTE90_014298 [Oedothorax gibbosus]
MNSSNRDFENVPVMWKPNGEQSEAVKRFVKLVKEKYKVDIGNYWDRLKWSIDNLEEFWEEVWEFAQVKCSRRFDKVIDLNIPMGEIPKWFVGAKLNFAENLLRYRDDHVALITAGEDRETGKVTYAEMYEHVKLYAAAFRKFGIKKGDIIVCYMSNREEPVYAMLAAVSIGAIWTGALPLLGAQAVLNRFQQVSPRIMLTIDRFRQSQEEKEMLDKVKEISDRLTSLEKVIIVPSKPESKLKDISGIRNSCFLEDFLKIGLKEDGSVPPLEFEQVDFSYPVFISYTSGTTGLPKPVVHGTGGLLSTSRDFYFHTEATRETSILSISPVGWASWNILAAYHFFGITIILFEGVPFFLSPTYLWDLVDEFKITNLFVTPSILDDLEKKGYVPTEKHKLDSIKVFISGGSIVKPHNYDFVYRILKHSVIFASGYGSTELLGSCMIIDRSLPIYRGEITCPSLGIDLECLDDSGNPVVGEMGELVIKKPTPSLPIGLWGDKNGIKFKQTYFSQFPNKFAIGDLAIINPVTKGITIFCRSDETLKPRGCRFGSSEIYNVVNAFEEVHDSICVSQYSKNRHERALLFVKVREGYKFDDDLVGKIKAAIAQELSVRHVPDLVFETADVPHNMNGKKMEITVKKLINNMPFNADTVINQESLDNFRNVPPRLIFLCDFSVLVVRQFGIVFIEMWMQRHFTDTPILWEPEENAGIFFKRFQKIVEEKEGIQFDNYWDFQKWSVDNVAEFWEYSYNFLGVIHSKKYDKVFDVNVPMSECPKWFEGARLNYAENLLKFRDDQVALILAGEDRETEEVTYSEMFKEAELYAAAFRKLGLKKDDIVVCYMSNRKEAVFAMQAVVSIGAIWTGALPLMGAQPVLSRFEQVKF